MHAFRLACAGAFALALSALPAAADTPAAPTGGAALAGPGTAVTHGPGVPPLPAVDAGGWIVADLGTGEVLAAHDAHGRYGPASTLKMLTAVTLIPLLPPQRIYTVTNADVAVDGSKVGLVPNTRYRVNTLFTALLVVSGNDAADALASAAGGQNRTIALMNEEARHLQADDTVARTVNGLDAPGQVTSAYDLALIARAGMAMPEFRRYVAIRTSYVPAPGGKYFQIYTHNELFRHGYPGAIGIKNGYTVAAGASFVGAATRGGRTLVVVLLHTNPLYWRTAAALLDWGFATDGQVAPVGVLVPPASPVTSTDARAKTAAVAPAAAAVRLKAAHRDALPIIPLTGVGVGAVTLLGVGTRGARRRWRRRRKLQLPHW